MWNHFWKLSFRRQNDSSSAALPKLESAICRRSWMRISLIWSRKCVNSSTKWEQKGLIRWRTWRKNGALPDLMKEQKKTQPKYVISCSNGIFTLLPSICPHHSLCLHSSLTSLRKPCIRHLRGALGLTAQSCHLVAVLFLKFGFVPFPRKVVGGAFS